MRSHEREAMLGGNASSGQKPGEDQAEAQCHLVLWGGTPVPQPTPSSASPDLVDCTSSRARAPGAAQGSRPTKTVRIWENYGTLRKSACATSPTRAYLRPAGHFADSHARFRRWEP